MSNPIHPYAVYTTDEAAKLLKVSVATIQRYIRDRKLQAVKVGKWYRVSGEALIDFMALSHQAVSASFQRVSTVEESIYRRSLSFLLNDSKGAEYLQLFDLTAQTLLALLNPDHNVTDNQMTIKYIGIRAFNHAMVAFRNTLSGYYQTSYAIQRDLLEMSFLSDYFRSNPAEIAKWKAATNEERVKDFSPSSVYKKLDIRDGFREQKRKKMYQEYCEYGSHVSYPGIKLLTNDQNLVEIGPFYNEKKLINTIYDLLRNFGALVAYLGANLKISDARTASLTLKHMEEFDKAFRLGMVEGEKFKKTKAEVERLIQQLVDMQQTKVSG